MLVAEFPNIRQNSEGGSSVVITAACNDIEIDDIVDRNKTT